MSPTRFGVGWGVRPDALARAAIDARKGAMDLLEIVITFANQRALRAVGGLVNTWG